MATLDEFKAFSKQFKMNGPGIYVIQPETQKQMPIKVGYSSRLIDRFRSYQTSMPWGFRILGVARVPNAQHAERLLKESLALADHVVHGKEWIDPKKRNVVLNRWAQAHQAYARNGPLGQYVFTADEIKSRKVPDSYKPLPERRVSEKTEQVVVPLRSVRPGPPSPPREVPTAVANRKPRAARAAAAERIAEGQRFAEALGLSSLSSK